MIEFEHDAPDVVNTLENRALCSAIRAVVYSDSRRNFDAFMRTFIESTIIVLIDSPIRTPLSQVRIPDKDGYEHFQKNSEIPLVQLSDEVGNKLLPIFTNVSMIHLIADFERFRGLAITALDLLEMVDISGADYLIFNPNSSEQLNIDANSLRAMSIELKKLGMMPAAPLFEIR